ncbi:MAG TPA: META domain-containing protein [Ignavibacteria bacterium]|nr:META domain-containing protein [Ignavibacteria bacterium]
MKTITTLSKYFFLPSLLIAAFIFISCSSSGSERKMSGPPFENTMWALISVTGDSVTADFDVKFSTGQVTGTGPCNSFTGVYNLNGTVVSISKILSTDVGCAQIQMEGEYLRLLGAAQRYDIQNGYLKIFTSVDYKVMTFAPAN